MIPDSFKQDLLNRVDIVDVVQRSVQLRKAGANFVGLCPFHDEKTPSFSVSPAKQFYHCFGCGAHGNAIGFLMEYASLGYIDALKELASQCGMQVPESRAPSPAEQARREREPSLFALNEKALGFYRAELKKAPHAVIYLKNRGITGEVAARFGLGYAPNGWNALREAFDNYEDAILEECGLVVKGEDKRYDRFRDRVMFPIFNSRGNAVVGFGGRVLDSGEPKYLNSPETPVFQKGREVYNLFRAMDAIRSEGRVLVVEGYMDVIALAQYGVGNAVATLGTATTPEHVAKLLRVADEVVFCFDGDAAGRKAAWRALEVSLPLAPDHKPIRFLFLPDGEDPDTFVRKHGKDAFEKKVREAEMLSQFLLAQLRTEADLATPEGRSKFVTIAKPLLQKVAAPVLRVQLANEIAQLGKIEAQASVLLALPEAKRPYAQSAPARPNYKPPNSSEWRLLYSLLLNLSMAEHVSSDLLDPERMESVALIAIRDACREFEVEPSIGLLLDRLQGSKWVEVALQAQRYGEELNFSPEAASNEFTHALGNLDLLRRKRELDELRKAGLTSKDALVAFQQKNLDYKRLQGALPSP